MHATSHVHPGKRGRGLRPLAALAALLLATAVPAQPAALPSFELERLQVNPSGAGSLLVGTGELLPAGGYRFSLLEHYEKDPLLYYRGDERVGAVVGHRLTTHLGVAWAPVGWLELGGQLPLVMLQRGDDLTAEGIAPPGGGVAVSTPGVNLRVKLLSQQEEDGVDLALGLGAGLPVGSAAALARDPSWRFSPSVMVGRRYASLRAGLEAGVLVRPGVVLSQDADVQDELGSHVRLGGTLATTGEGLRGEVNVLASVPLTRERVALETLAGLRLPLGESLEAFAAGGIGFGNPPGTPAARVLLGLAFGNEQTAREAADPRGDTDDDGVRNADDRCPGEGGNVDASGCPVRDADGDGVPDAKDTCPDQAGAAGGDGCPAPDQDGDGVPDEQDRCPSHVGRAENEGCPVGEAPPGDSDGDGVPNAEDRCPERAGRAESGGCPGKDGDGDGVVDAEDRCPRVQGRVEHQGCLEAPKTGVSIQEGPQGSQLVTAEPIVFLLGEADVQPRLVPQLDEVARFLQAHPELTKVSVDGHTDSTGPVEFNRQLSLARAEAVRAYLISKGVEPSRLQTRGFGPDRPLQSNATEEGRAANRRVEFIIISRVAER